MKVFAFYSFFEVEDLNLIKDQINNFFKTRKVKGQILIGFEGLNGTIAVNSDEEKKVNSFLIQLGVSQENIKISDFDGKRVFKKFKIKIKREIVTSDFNLSIKDIESGKFINPKEWDNFTKQDDVVIIDTRNDYEYKIGHFKNAINPNIKTFKEFKKYIENEKLNFKNKKVAIYCTGGIRCEKAGPLMKKFGIETYQLKGGILKYFEETSAPSWDGECFVFDYRVAVNKQLQPGKSEICYGCNMPLTQEERQSHHYEEDFSCPNCYDQLTKKRKRSLTDKREYRKSIL